MHFRRFLGLFLAFGSFWVIFCSVLLMFVFCFFLFCVFVFETLCILGVLLVCLWFLDSFGLFFVVFCICLCFVSFFFGLLLLKLYAF